MKKKYGLAWALNLITNQIIIFEKKSALSYDKN